jgi:hypothetical protein
MSLPNESQITFMLLHTPVHGGISMVKRISAYAEILGEKHDYPFIFLKTSPDLLEYPLPLACSLHHCNGIPKDIKDTLIYQIKP